MPRNNNLSVVYDKKIKTLSFLYHPWTVSRINMRVLITPGSIWKRSCIDMYIYMYMEFLRIFLCIDKHKRGLKIPKGELEAENPGEVMVLNATFNNISVIWWSSVLLVEETGVSGENYQPVASH